MFFEEPIANSHQSIEVDKLPSLGRASPGGRAHQPALVSKGEIGGLGSSRPPKSCESVEEVHLEKSIPGGRSYMLLWILILLLLFGGGGGYYAYGPTGGLGIGGIVLIVLVVMLLTGRL